MENNAKTGKPYEDNLCFFRCLALNNDCYTKNLKRDTQYYYQRYRDAGLSKKKFHGVKISELDELEKLFEVNIQVYSLAPTQTHGEDEDNEENTPEIAATLLRRRDKSYFVSNDKAFIYKQLVQETMKRPDKSMPHRKLHNRGVRQKTFSEIVGVHGFSKGACYTVTVIYDTTNHKLITAFPTI